MIKKKGKEKEEHSILKINKYIINEQKKVKITMKVKIKKIKTISVYNRKRN